MKNKKVKLMINDYLTKKQLSRTKIMEIPEENKIIVSIKNSSQEHLNVEVYEQMLLVISLLQSYNLKFSISHQYKNDKKGIQHIDITYQDMDN
ncbi:hypothetical protein [Macrococcus bovicus]|uniref:Uncharacterized protein n=1 Tax=Macrococcus bovicus TaxID=69968 RepID=A0A4R6BW77_9STAP|nr:hypothetical protein [Macrococcus bovicus]TDM12460.1 hypothetical protein ERX55_10660 [Macrococcus bovicus]